MSGLSVMYFTCDTNKKNQESKGERYNNFSKYNNNIKLWYVYCRGFPGGSVLKNLPVIQETRVQTLGQEDPLEKEMATHSSFLA